MRANAGIFWLDGGQTTVPAMRPGPGKRAAGLESHKIQLRIMKKTTK
jgi:hypothetical protein